MRLSSKVLAGTGALAVGVALFGMQTQPPTEKPTAEVAPGACLASGCHADIKDHAVMHGPAAVGACDACHTTVDVQQHTFALVREAKDLCLFCHEMNVEGAETVHEPLKTGDCLACHDPHGGTSRLVLKAESPSALCAQCHKDVFAGKSTVHGPVAAGACAACHSPHASSHPHLLLVEGRDLCLQCHTSTKEQVETMRYVHGPVNTDCTACHDPHASDHPMMLHAEKKELCLSCHEAIKHIVDTATTQHAAVTTDQECLNCHEAHASDYASILQTDMKDLCLKCHDRSIKMPDGRDLANMKAVLATGKSLHGPVAQGNCAACHEIHGGGNFRLLIKEYPPQFYAPFREESYALCFSCHEKDLVHDEKTTALTNFRNGDTNLHFLHVNKEKKGRTCRACHETHASNKENHIRDSVPFGTGGWPLPINFEKLADGGKCAPGCHLPYEYNRDHPVEYPPPVKPAIWPGEGKTGEGAGSTKPDEEKK